MGPARIPPEIRFWAKVNKAGTIPKRRRLGRCWLWTAGVNEHGYGAFGVEHSDIWLAHRYAYFLKYGPIPAKALVLHKCDNPPCVRYGHLYLGTHKRNSQDMKDRDRAPYGERGGQTKLSSAQVKELRNLEGTALQRELGARFGISQSTVSRIFSGEIRSQG